MAEEKTAGEQPEGKAEEPTPESKPEAEPTVPERNLESELAEAKKEVEKWQKEAKAHQSTASKKAQEAKSWQDQVTGLREEFRTFAEVVAEEFDERNREEGEIKPQKTSLKERIKSTYKPTKSPEIVAKESHALEVGQQIGEIEKKLGINFKEHEDGRVYLNYVTGNEDMALKMAQEIESKMTENKESPDSKDKEIAELKEELERQKKIASGELASEKGLPAGDAGDESLLKRWGDGEDLSEEEKIRVMELQGNTKYLTKSRK